MSDLDLSRSAKALLKAAKSDGPSAAARAKIWGGVASGAGAAGVVGVSAGAIGAGIAGANAAASVGGASAGGASAGIGAGTVAAGLGGGKLLGMGALFGSALTVGIAATLLGIGRSPSLMPDPQYAEPTSMVQPAYTNGGAVHPSGAAAGRDARDANEAAHYGNAFGANGASARARIADGASDGRGASALIDVPTIASAPALGANPIFNGKSNGNDANGRPLGIATNGTSNTPGAAPTAVRVAREDTLMRESALVAEARGALMRGDSKAALAALKAAKTLKHRELEPEELSLEAKALRAIGRDGDAASLEIVLKSRYPDHALAR